MKNRVIITGLWLTRISLTLNIAVYLVLLGMIIYWHASPESFDDWYISQPFHAGGAKLNMQHSPMAQGMTLNQMSAGMVYWLLIRTTLFFVLVFIALKKILRILTSLSSSQAFFEENIRHFKSLALIGLLYSLLSLVNFGVIDGHSVVNFAIPTQPLLFAVACWILAEIFTEGSRLQADSNSII